MPEILTESFCERCGTRYTFEAAAPKTRRLGRLKILSKGLANFVLSDESSLDEAFAEARSDEQRETTNHQLDAFHKTFQFCMSCRQYTCGNCWNEVDGRCLSCAPHLGHEILEAPFPNLDPTAGLVLADAEAAEHAGNGQGVHATIDASAWPTMDLASVRQPEPAGAESIAKGVAEAPAEVVPLAESVVRAVAEPGIAPVALEPVAAIAAAEAEPVAAIAAAEAERVQAVAEAERVQAVAEAERVQAVAEAERVQAVAEAAAAATTAASTAAERRHEHAAALAAHSTDLFARFRLANRTSTPALAPPDRVAATGDGGVVSEPEPAQAAHEAIADPTVTGPASAGQSAAQAAAPEPVTAAEPPALEPTTAATAAAPATPAAPAREDRVEAPVWRIVAPEAPVPPTPSGSPVPAPADTPPPQWPMPAAAAEPQWPIRPAAVAPVQADLWAASSQDVLNRPGSGVQACVTCGLPLSATARFCRRCGSQQH
jgi:hypothetical protein